MYRLIKPSITCVILVVLLCSCRNQVNEGADRLNTICAGRGGEVTDPCPISFITLAANPDLFDGKYLRVSGFYMKGPDHLLFSDKESADAGVVANAVLVSSSLVDAQLSVDRNGHYMLVAGKFLYAAPVKGEFTGSNARGLLGEMIEAQIVRGTAIGIPYECWGHREEAKDKVESERPHNSECQ